MTAGTDPRDEILDHLPAMRAFALSLARDMNSADDLVQDSIVKAWSNLDKFEPGTNLRAWLFTILRNTYYSERRKRRFEVEDPDGSLIESIAETPRHDGRLALDDFRVAFSRLSTEHREALALVGAQGFSYEEAASMCGCAVGTIKSRTNRARRQLARLMGHEADGDMGLTDTGTVAVVNGTTNV